jgi:putative flippase GtrA
MIEWTKKTYNDLDQKYAAHMKIVRYIISGGTSAVTDLFLLYLFTDIFHIWYIISAALAFIIAFFVSFTLQKYWTFRDNSNEGIKKQGLMYFVIGLINLGVNTLLVYFFTEYLFVFLRYDYLVSQVCAAGLIAIVSFFVYQKFIFRK